MTTTTHRTSSHFAALLYILLRDHINFGTMEKLVLEHVEKPLSSPKWCGDCVLDDEHMGRYAEGLAWRIQNAWAENARIAAQAGAPQVQRARIERMSRALSDAAQDESRRKLAKQEKKVTDALKAEGVSPEGIARLQNLSRSALAGEASIESAEDLKILQEKLKQPVDGGKMFGPRPEAPAWMQPGASAVWRYLEDPHAHATFIACAIKELPQWSSGSHEWYVTLGGFVSPHSGHEGTYAPVDEVDPGKAESVPPKHDWAKVGAVVLWRQTVFGTGSKPIRCTLSQAPILSAVDGVWRVKLDYFDVRHELHNGILVDIEQVELADPHGDLAREMQAERDDAARKQKTDAYMEEVKGRAATRKPNENERKIENSAGENEGVRLVTAEGLRKQQDANYRDRGDGVLEATPEHRAKLKEIADAVHVVVKSEGDTSTTVEGPKIIPLPDNDSAWMVPGALAVYCPEGVEGPRFNCTINRKSLLADSRVELSEFGRKFADYDKEAGRRGWKRGSKNLVFPLAEITPNPGRTASPTTGMLAVAGPDSAKKKDD